MNRHSEARWRRIYQHPGRGIPLNMSGPFQPSGVLAKRVLAVLLGLVITLVAVAPDRVPQPVPVQPVPPEIDQVTPVGLAPANSTNVAPVPTIVFPGTIVTKAFGPVKPLLLHPVEMMHRPNAMP